MLATAGRPPNGPGWALEFKWDGIRALATAGAAAGGGSVRLVSRNGNELTDGYPELTTGPAAEALAHGRRVLLDGELVAHDASGRPDFGLLQQRMHLRHPSPEVLAQVPVVFYVFDLLHLDGRSLLAESYDVRRAQLAALGLDAVAGVAMPPHYTDMPAAALLEVAREHGLEGMVSKRRSSRYEAGRRSPAWIKTALLSTQEVLIGGWTPGQGRRTRSIGALLLGARDGDGRLRYLGHVGTGFTAAMLSDLLARLEPLAQRGSAFDEEVPAADARHARWVRPVLVGEVVYRTLTHDRLLRHAAWRGLRPDRDPGEVTLSGDAAG